MTMGWLQVVARLVLGIHQLWKNVFIPIALVPWDVCLLPRCIRVDSFLHNPTVSKYAKVTPLAKIICYRQLQLHLMIVRMATLKLHRLLQDVLLPL